MADRGAPSTLTLAIRTPHEVVFEGAVTRARVPTGTGQVGLRPRNEPAVLVIEPGLLLLGPAGAGPSFAATAGGLLELDRGRATLFTPFAVVGASATEVADALDRALATPDSELAARRRLGELEQRIVRELKGKPGRATAGSGGATHG